MPESGYFSFLKRVNMKPTKIEKAILDAIKTSKFGLPDWGALAKSEHVSLDYLQARLDWMRKVGMIK
jgi:hypothetical protein